MRNEAAGDKQCTELHAIERLSHRMGLEYMEAVLTCLRGSWLNSAHQDIPNTGNDLRESVCAEEFQLERCRENLKRGDIEVAAVSSTCCAPLTGEVRSSPVMDRPITLHSKDLALVTITRPISLGQKHRKADPQSPPGRPCIVPLSRSLRGRLDPTTTISQ